jgi:RNA polymerase primary sigma factor
MDIDNEKEIFNDIFNSYNKNGFVTNEYILDLISDSNISLSNVEYFIQKIINSGILVIDEKYEMDHAFHDYNKTYNEIIKEDKSFSYIINYVKKIKPPQMHEFENLFLRSKDDNSYARNRIIEMNLRLALRHALYFHKKYALELDEAIGYAFIGLILGYEKYDTNKTLKFQNHIQWWIRQPLYREVSIGNKFIRYPAHLRNKLFIISDLFHNKSEDYFYKNKNDLIINIKRKLSCSTKDAMLYYNCYLNYLPLDSIEKNEGISLNYDLIKDLDESILKKQINNTLSTLPSREQIVIESRFGLNGYKAQTLDELGDKLGITRERVRQIETKALERLRHSTSLLIAWRDGPVNFFV